MAKPNSIRSTLVLGNRIYCVTENFLASQATQKEFRHFRGKVNFNLTEIAGGDSVGSRKFSFICIIAVPNIIYLKITYFNCIKTLSLLNVKTFLGEMYVLGIIRDKFVAIECFSESHKFDTRCSSTLIITLKECKKLINQSVCCFQGC